jgi:hypothetical protein
MKRNDNYPDDIRQFDDHPMSPFFTPPNVDCAECGSSKPDDEMFSLFDGDTNEERRFCSEDCHDAYVNNNAADLVVELIEVAEALIWQKSMMKQMFDSAYYLAKNTLSTAAKLKAWRKDSPEHDEACMLLKKHNATFEGLQEKKKKAHI